MVLQPLQAPECVISTVISNQRTLLHFLKASGRSRVLLRRGLDAAAASADLEAASDGDLLS